MQEARPSPSLIPGLIRGDPAEREPAGAPTLDDTGHSRPNREAPVHKGDWVDVGRWAMVVVGEIVALVVAVYAGFVAIVLLPPGMGGGSEDSTGLAIAGVVALVASVLLPSSGFLCGAYLWRRTIWLSRAAGACGVMVVIWLLLLVARVGS
jgi:hypothetical protein